MHKKNPILYVVLVVLGIMSAVMFQNCSEVKPLTSQGDLAPEPPVTDEDGDGGDDGSGGNGSGDSGSGDGSDDSGSGNNGQPGSYDNSDPYKCDYNDDGIIDFETKTNGVANTVRPAGMELIQPQGFYMHYRSWEDQWGQAFDIRDVIPSTLGAFSVDANDSRGMYITIPFKVPNRNGQWRVSWNIAQPNYMGSNYPFARTSMATHVTISPCAGDVRPRNSDVSEPWTRYCRWTTAAGQVIFNSKNEVGCQVQKNKTYYLTIMMADPRTPDFTGVELLPTEESCADPQNSTQNNTVCESAFWYEVE